MKRRSVSTLLAFAVLAASPFTFAAAAHADSSNAGVNPTAVTTSVTPSATPTTSVSQADAEHIARTLLSLSQDQWSLASVDTRTGQNSDNRSGHPSYLLSFNALGSAVPKGYSAEVDATDGQLLSMSYWNKTQTSTGNLTEQEIQAVAANFLQKVAPDAFKQSVLQPDPKAVFDPQAWTNFTYVRQVNGIPVLGDQIRMSVTSDGQIANYSLDWTDATFPSAANVIIKDQANQIYKQTLDMRLQYFNYFGSNAAKMQEKLVYEPTYRILHVVTNGSYAIVNPLIDAQTGKTIGADGQPTTDLNTTDTAQPLVAGGPTVPPALSADLTQDDAIKLATSLGLIPADAVLLSSEYRPMQGNPIWQLTYEIQGEDNGKPYLSITLNAKTGEVEDYNYADPQMGQSTNSLSPDQLRDKAIQIVKQLYPNRVGGLTGPLDQSSQQNNSSFTFLVLKNGIATNLQLSLMLNPTDGTLVNASLNDSVLDYDQISYPDPQQAISKDQAEAVYMANQPLELAYYFPTDSNGNLEKTPLLVYTPNVVQADRFAVDAQTGTWLDKFPDQQPNPLPTDIKGHWAEKQLTQFAERGLLELDNGQAHPDQQMTRAQFVRLLVDYKQAGLDGSDTQTFSDVPKDSKYYRQIETAVQQKWIAAADTFHPDATITREEAATILARVLGFSDLASHREIFQLPYSDAGSVDDWAYGSVAIDYGLGLMKGVDATHFAPHSTLTLAEAATMLSKTTP